MQVPSIKGFNMSDEIVCKLDGVALTINKINWNDTVKFCLHNFDTKEAIDAYSPLELLAIRNSIDEAINTFCSPKDLTGQLFMWEHSILD